MSCTRFAGNTGRKRSPSWHHRTNLSGHIFPTNACFDNRKKNLLNANTPSTCHCNMVNFGPITAENCWRVSGTPTNFNGFRVLAALLHQHHSSSGRHTSRRWTEGATYNRQGGHHVGHWPTFVVWYLRYAAKFVHILTYLSFVSWIWVTMMLFHSVLWMLVGRQEGEPSIRHV